MTNKRTIRILLIEGLLLVLLWGGLKAWRINRAVQSLLAVQTQAQGLLRGGITAVTPDQAEQLVTTIRQDVTTITQELAFARPLLPHLGWLPKVGSTAVVAPHLLDMAEAGVDAAAYAVRGLKPGLAVFKEPGNAALPGDTGSRLPELVAVVAAARPDLQAAGVALQKVAASRAAIGDTTALPSRLQTAVALLDTYLPMAQDGLAVAQVLPQLMGADGKARHYLILAQNEDELRPTGGFITGVGVMVVQDGRLLSLSFEDSNRVDHWESKPYDFPPQPLYDLMGLELFLFRDANWSPDFSTSAQQALDLYSYGQDVPPLDGVIALDQRFLQLLLEATGPITVEGVDRPVYNGNVIESLQTAWGIQDNQAVNDWIRDRKAFLSHFAAALKDKLLGDITAVNPLLLAQNVNRALQERHLQLYMREPAVAAVLRQIHWDGHVPSPAQEDFFFLAQANVGYNKANFQMATAVTYHVTLAEDGTAASEVAIAYTNQSPASAAPCRQAVEYSNAPSYLDLTAQCYFNYARLYVPAGAQLLAGTPHPAPATAFLHHKPWDQPPSTSHELAGLTTFGNFVLVPTGTTVTDTYRYGGTAVTLPAPNGEQQYRLHLHKQAGTPAQPFTVIVTLPPGMVLTEANLEPATAVDNTYTFVFSLEQDTNLSLTYHPLP